MLEIKNKIEFENNLWAGLINSSAFNSSKEDRIKAVTDISSITLGRLGQIYKDEDINNLQEGWELGELFAQFYFLKEAVEMFGRGKAYVANTTIPLWKDEIKVKEINEILIPKVTERILEILTPEINEMDKNKFC